MLAPEVAVQTHRSPVIALRARLPQKRRKVQPRRVELRRSHVVNELLFRHAIVRERKRADRFEEAFALLLVSLDCNTARTNRWTLVADALSEQRPETDLIGWYEQGAVIGLMRPLAGQDPGDVAADLAVAVQRQLTQVLAHTNSEGCSIRLEVYSPHREAISPVLLESENARQRSLKRLRRCAKRTLDIAGSLGLLAALSPVFLLVAALVKLTSRGPVFFRQERIGEGGQPFRMLKFRTMRVDADESIHKQYVTSFIQSGPTATADSGVFKIVNDPRVTHVGHVLRRASLDELPQFWNVLKGEMSLVGPRPPLAYEVENYKHWHRRRLLEAKPGITGLWQVTGRSRTTFEEMVRLDLRYAKNHSVWTDIKILLATPRAVVTGKGAH